MGSGNWDETSDHMAMCEHSVAIVSAGKYSIPVFCPAHFKGFSFRLKKRMHSSRPIAQPAPTHILSWMVGHWRC